MLPSLTAFTDVPIDPGYREKVKVCGFFLLLALGERKRMHKKFRFINSKGNCKMGHLGHGMFLLFVAPK